MARQRGAAKDWTRALARKTDTYSTKPAKSQRTFITYAQENQAFKNKVLALADRLRSDGVDTRIDQYETHPARGWSKWMEDQFAEADKIIVVPSKTYLERYNQDSGVGSGARFEAAILRTILVKNGVSFEHIGVALLDKADAIYIPDLLHGCQRYVTSNDSGYEDIYRWLTDQQIIAPKVGLVKKLDRARTRSPLNFESLCRSLKPLFNDNYRVFRDFGPNSGADSKGPVRYNLNAWYSLRESKIAPNNRLIRAMVIEHRSIIPERYKATFEKLISHIDAFEAHIESDLVDYREHQFPQEIVEIVNLNSNE